MTRRVSLEFSHHSLRIKTPSIVHPLHCHPIEDHISSKRQAKPEHVKNMLFVYCIPIVLCIRHIHCVLLLRRNTRWVCISSSSQLYILLLCTLENHPPSRFVVLLQRTPYSGHVINIYAHSLRLFIFFPPSTPSIFYFFFRR